VRTNESLSVEKVLAYSSAGIAVGGALRSEITPQLKLRKSS